MQNVQIIAGKVFVNDEEIAGTEVEKVGETRVGYLETYPKNGYSSVIETALKFLPSIAGDAAFKKAIELALESAAQV
jgi:hypothetical protein